MEEAMALVEGGPTLEVGWAVIGGDGEHIARIEEIGPGYVMIRVGLLGRERIYVPISAVRRVDQTVGNVSIEPNAESIGTMGWEEKPGPSPRPATSPSADEDRVLAGLGMASVAGRARAVGEGDDRVAD
jgi:hypothetical protein